MDLNDAAVDGLIRRAVAERRFVEFVYKGAPRVVEPHDYGILKGRRRLLAYQVGGRSGGPLPDWRMFDVDALERLVVSDRTFPGSRNRSGQSHKVWDQLFCRVE